jgi:hypothetical protein
MKGYRTVIFGLATAVLPVALTYLGGIDWTKLGISPGVAIGLGAMIIALRAATTTAIGSKAPPAPPALVPERPLPQ